MPVLKSLGDLKRVREKALQEKQVIMDYNEFQVIVSMGSCGIAVGAQKTLKTIQKFIEDEMLSGVTVTQTGCSGLCQQEPIVHVLADGQPPIAYGKVDVQIAEKIMKQHIHSRQPVTENMIRIQGSIPRP